MTKQAALKTARAEANKHQFGTREWEAAMVVVRALVNQVNAERAPFEHTSVDGDIWAPR
jgi:peroxiredoxin